ncbi:MAG: hypothetical protein MR991_06955 [Clostridiales bacterium]|nr:hypothetical protein [Clostridiales bacterium]MDD7036170.1 hypothetical protein [Bacillota bacterium]MDY2920884.1 hypothetical protein [Lentihominibacter sp.]
MNFNNIFMIKQAKDKFFRNHPKTETFMEDVKREGFCEGMEIAVAVRYPGGKEYKTGIRVQDSDMQLLNMLKDM